MPNNKQAGFAALSRELSVVIKSSTGLDFQVRLVVAFCYSFWLWVTKLPRLENNDFIDKLFYTEYRAYIHII